jgi:chorismate-pyruvate lyase
VSVDLETLVRLFYEDAGDLGRFFETSADAVPAAYRALLAHSGHMTETVEAHHHDRVDVDVLAKQVTPTHYARKILLRRQRDRRVVQFGIMRVAFAFLPAAARAEIEAETTPLGRVLIEHNVLRSVELVALWRVEPGRDLCQLFKLSSGVETYGRTALIYCNHEPAVELLEIVTPE